LELRYIGGNDMDYEIYEMDIKQLLQMRNELKKVKESINKIEEIMSKVEMTPKELD
jgi:hypothetical protein